MTRLKTLPSFAAVPDMTVLSKAETSALIGLSADTLDRMHRERTGPPRVQLSARRIGYPVGALRQWLVRRGKASPGDAA